MSRYAIGWIDIYSKVSKMQGLILDACGKPTKEQHQEAFKIVDKNFSTWDNQVYSCSNGDRHYAPIVFVWYATTVLKCKHTQPIKIMRAIYEKLQNQLQ